MTLYISHACAQHIHRHVHVHAHISYLAAGTRVHMCVQNRHVYATERTHLITVTHLVMNTHSQTPAMTRDSYSTSLLPVDVDKMVNLRSGNFSNYFPVHPDCTKRTELV